jgi:orotate phosphoribosyltransferase
MRDGLAAEISAVARRRGSFRLRSGALTGEYFDKYRFESEPDLLRRIASRLIRLLPSDTAILAGLELGGVPLATVMSLETGLPVVFVRKAPKDYGTCQAIEGRSVTGKKVAVIEDVITTGGMVIQGAARLREAGAQLTAILCVIWRADGPPRLEALPDVTVRAVMTRAELG